MARLLGNPRLIRWTLLLALLTSFFAAPIHSQSTKANPTPAPKPEVNLSTPESTQPPAVDQKAEHSPPASPEQLRQAQIEADTKKLYQLSAELRAEVAKTYKESLSLTVLRKAEEVEMLAKSLRVIMTKEAAIKH
jgi:hypothetical protein